MSFIVWVCCVRVPHRPFFIQTLADLRLLTPLISIIHLTVGITLASTFQLLFYPPETSTGDCIYPRR